MELTFSLELDFHKFNKNLLSVFFEDRFELLKFTSYGHTEPLKLKIEKSQKEKFYELWDKYLSVIVKGKSSFWLSISTSSSGIISCGGGIKLNEGDDKLLEELISFIESFSEYDCLIHATILDINTYDIKHKVIDNSSYSWDGVSVYDFLEFMPGIYWYNYFGKEYVNALGIEKIGSLDSVTYTNSELNVSFYFKEDILENPLLISKLESIEESIGADYFFSKNRERKNLKHPKGFESYLKSLEL